MDQVLILLENFSKNGLISIVDHKNDSIKLTITNKSKLNEQSFRKLFSVLLTNVEVNLSLENIVNVIVGKNEFNTYNMLMYACIEENLNIVISVLGYCKQDDYDAFACATIVEYFNSTKLFHRVKFDQNDYSLFLDYMLRYERLENIYLMIGSLEKVKSNILCYAIRTGDKNIINTLISSKKISVSDFKKDNPLIWAFKYGDEEVIDYYLFQWCDGNNARCEYILDTLTRTPCIMLAKFNHHPKVVAKYGPIIEKIKKNPKIKDGKIIDLR